METTISASDANRRFSELLRTIKRGRSVVVTSHGIAVARIVPIDAEPRTPARAKQALLERLRKQRPINVGRWTREDLYN